MGQKAIFNSVSGLMCLMQRVAFMILFPVIRIKNRRVCAKFHGNRLCKKPNWALLLFTPYQQAAQHMYANRRLASKNDFQSTSFLILVSLAYIKNLGCSSILAQVTFARQKSPARSSPLMCRSCCPFANAPARTHLLFGAYSLIVKANCGFGQGGDRGCTCVYMGWSGMAIDSNVHSQAIATVVHFCHPLEAHWVESNEVRDQKEASLEEVFVR